MNPRSWKQVIAYSLLAVGCLCFSFAFQQNTHQIWGQRLLDSLSESQKREPQNALKGLSIHPELELKVFATEPMLQNPTNIDVDAKGRVWVLEAYNYRPGINGNPTNAEGDKILILEDSNGDGLADKRSIFYQSKDLNSPLGIAVLDSMVIVSQSPYMWKMFDDNRDGKADRKEILFQGIGGEQHDHGAHAFVFGPDGKLYFNFGNEGKQLLDAQGKAVLDQDGDPIGPKKYKQGMVFRCNLDGSQVECLGHNFRNNFEVAVDSYGALWQSDNDDDGNKGVRINHVMPYGNYGYTDELTGAGWSVNRTNIEPEIPRRHWHLNDPGVVPNLLQTGSGSPTGILVYEGNLLPEVFRNQIIHCDAGPNVLRSYPVKPNGAGYSAEIVNLIEGKNDQWFRPADVATAPDGSLFVADWYDPGVGGHQAGDQVKGRIYRLAPKNHAYKIEPLDLSNVSKSMKALENPNLETRYLAFRQLQKLGTEATKAEEQSFLSNPNPRFRARAFWLLAQSKSGLAFIEQAAKDPNPSIRMMAIRAMSRKSFGLWRAMAQNMVSDADPQVRRELAIAMRHNASPNADKIWAKLATQHDGQDRWYLEALGIGADGAWEGRLEAYLEETKTAKPVGFQDIIWRSRTEQALPYLTETLKSSIPLDQKLRYFRALDFIPGNTKSELLVNMINKEFKQDQNAQLLAIRHMVPTYIQTNAVARKTLLGLLPKTTEIEYLELVEKYELAEENSKLLNMILAGKQARKAGQVLYKLAGGAELLAKTARNGNEKIQRAVIESIRWQGKQESLALLYDIMTNSAYLLAVQREAARSIGNSSAGEDYALAILKNKKVPAAFIPGVVESVSRTWRKAIRMEANSYLGATAQGSKTKHPPLNELVTLKGNAKEGIKSFINQCSMCHQIDQNGIDFGPKLSEIGSKLSKDGLYLSILHPNAGIGFGYETYEIKTKSGDTYQGIVMSKTETDVILKLPGGTVQNFKTSSLSSVKQLPESLMPEGLADQMSTAELSNLIEYLTTLKKK